MPRVNDLEATGEIYRAPSTEVLIFTGTQSRQALAEAFHSQARGCR
jgi:DNA-binding NarL/FixJ family response regulator